MSGGSKGGSTKAGSEAGASQQNARALVGAVTPRALSRRGRAIGTLVILGGLAVIVGGLGLWKYRSIQRAIADAAKTPEPSETVEAVEVGTTMWAPVSSLVGSVQAIQSVTLSNELAGTVTKVGFASGQVVEAGAVLLELDGASELASIEAAQASVVAGERAIDAINAQIRALEADMSLAELNFGRVEQAVENGSVSRQEADRARTEVTRTNAQLDAARAELVREQAQVAQLRAQVVPWQVMLGKKTIRAPFKARVGIRSVHPGQYLMEGTQVATLTGVSDRVFVDFLIPQSVAAQAVPGMKVPASGGVLGPGQHMLTVEAVDAQVDPRSRNIRVRTSIDDAAQRLRPGMFVEITVPVAPPRQVVVVPASALRRAAFGDHVFEIKPDAKDPSKMRVHQRMVKSGGTVGEQIILTEGVEPGVRVAGAGAFKLREGGLVTLAQPGGPKPPAATTAAPTP